MVLRPCLYTTIVQTENIVRHTKYGRIRGMVAGEGGRSTGVLLYFRYLECKSGRNFIDPIESRP